MTYYTIAKKFTDGILKGISYTEKSTVPMKVGLEVKKPIGGSPYKVLSCEKIVE